MITVYEVEPNHHYSNKKHAVYVKMPELQCIIIKLKRIVLLTLDDHIKTTKRMEVVSEKRMIALYEVKPNHYKLVN